ncbi:MAG: ATP-binding protein [Ferruginibacter sp.]
MKITMTLTNGNFSIDMRELFDDVAAIIVVFQGKDHVFEYCNKIYYKIIRSNTDIIGLSVKEALPELNGQGIYELLDNVYATGNLVEIAEMVVDIDVEGNGILTEMFFNLLCKPLKNDKNETTGIFVHAVDVTELVKTRKNAQENSDKFRDLIMTAPIATSMYTGSELTIEIANDKMISVMGKNKSIVGKKLVDALPELIGQPFLEILNKVYETGQPYHAKEQKALLEINNELLIFWFDLDYNPLFNKEGQVYGILNMAVDVTHQFKAKQKLAQAEEKLRSAIEGANLGTWEYNIVTGKIEMNQQLMDWRGIKSTEHLTLKDTLDTTVNAEKVKPVLENAFASNHDTSVDMEYDIVNPETLETKRFRSVGRTFLDEENRPVLMAGITYDITLQRYTENLMQEKIKSKTLELEDANNYLLQLNANLEQFVYVASHDLQEPLRKINIFSGMLQNRSEKLDEESKVYVNKIEKASKRMSLLINDLLEFSRISSKDRVFIPTDLNKIIGDIVIDYELLINQKSAEINVESLPIIEAIPLQMNQLFYNIIGNALKFTKETGTVRVNIFCTMPAKEEIAAMRLHENMSYCKISIEDNGIGFDQKYEHQIFEIFQRLHGRQEYAGTGIGLSLAKKITDNHGGVIAAQAKENMGAIFNIYLPVRRD